MSSNTKNFLIVLAFIIVLILIGIGIYYFSVINVEKEPLNGDTFTKKMQEIGYTIKDINDISEEDDTQEENTENLDYDSYYNSYLVATSPDLKITITFVDYKDEYDAKYAFESDLINHKLDENSKVTKSRVDGKNYSKVEYKTEFGKEAYSRVKNIYIRVTDYDGNSNIQKILKNIGY